MAIVTTMIVATVTISINAIIFMVLFYEMAVFCKVNARHVVCVVVAPEQQGAEVAAVLSARCWHEAVVLPSNGDFRWLHFFVAFW